jgi:anthranilate/para-aminobenzoate synthase component I
MGLPTAKLFARELPLPPNPLRLASRLAAESQLAFLWSACGTGPSFLGVRPIAESSELDPEAGLSASMDPNQLGRAPRWMGLVPYEAMRELERPGFVPAVDLRQAPLQAQPLWWRFGAVVCIGARVTVVGDDAASVDELSRQLLGSPERPAREVSLRAISSEPPERHSERVRAALDLIRDGDIYQVNLARRLDMHVEGGPIDLLRMLCRDTRPPYAAAFRFGENMVISTSPELLLRQHADGRLLTSPIKGTRPRGSDARTDAALRDELARDPKEHAELSMIIDVERNDLGRVSSIGSVRVQQPATVASHGLVWHRRANVISRLRPGVSRAEVMAAMLPSGSVTGAPKVRAMEIIAKLEAQRRGLYTGALGMLTQRGELTLAMAIRCLSVRADLGHYFTGGGIVADSQPLLELEETRWKARQLFRRSG